MFVKKVIFLVFLLYWLSQVQGQFSPGSQNSPEIEFPDIPGFITLKCDLHTHTVLSDGSVWPNIRVHEALRDGLDAISITDHLEYQPHQDDIPHTDRNRGYQIAAKSAEGHDLIVIPGAEITRDVPPGHCNAIFIEDANQLNQEDVMEVFLEARKQGAFIFWNHPGWLGGKKYGIDSLSEMHKKLLSGKLVDGVEIINGNTFYEDGFKLALENNLTFLGTSDVHGLIDWGYDKSLGLHRPVTLVFATGKSAEAIREGLDNQRTVVWSGNNLIGNAEFLVPLINASLEAEKYENNRNFSIRVNNNSDANYILENLSEYSFYNYPAAIVLNAHDSIVLRVKPKKDLSAVDLRFKVLNALTAPGRHPEIDLHIE